MSRERFIEIVTADQPETPAYFTHDAVLNSRERPTLDDALTRGLQALSLEQILELVEGGAQLLDTRDQADFEGAHIRGALNIGLGGSFATWCGTILDHARPIVLIAEPGRETEAATRLGRIGFDTVAGYLVGGMQQLDHAQELVERTERITAGSAAEQLAGPAPPLLIDVRTTREWSDAHIDGAVNRPLSQLRERLAELPPDRPLIVHCASGYRSAIATSLLRREGLPRVANLVGGLAAWTSAQLPTVGTSTEQEAV
jgi:rhodanese-related sulfurtransferase